MLEDDAPAPTYDEMLLTDEDFPNINVNMAHPKDYIIRSTPIQKEYIFHQHQGRHPCLHLRISIKLAEERFVAISFVLDTGAPKLYLCDILNGSIVKTDDDLGVTYNVR